ncbi:TolC family protein [uncultured Sphingomonas sp.]|uniref:TolC family protein n=1 Tax=uncultured Sphingomonas sp. TaxID=158754 RepID=UPI0025914E82|nr:TolC family protein [uncultured Sphingomonas sp.]
MDAMHSSVTLIAAVVSAAAQVQEPSLTYAAARARMESSSPSLASAEHAVAAAREAAATTRTLHRPTVTASAQVLEYQKTLAVDLSDARSNALGATQDFLVGLPNSLPPAFQQIANEVVGRIDRALPGLFALIPDSLSYRYRDTVFRPTVQAAVPFYTGGAIPAIQRGARAGVTMAQGRAAQARDLAQVNLVRVYFGRIAARALRASAQETRQALGSLYDDVQRSEIAGVTPRAATLEAAVARDGAERALQRAILADEAADEDLRDILDMPGAAPSTPLFVSSTALPPAETFMGGEGDTPLSRQADAAREVAGAAADLAKARYRPQVFGFGEYNANSRNALPTEPDWVVGIGARVTLLSGLDRGHTLAAAREGERAAAEAGRAARKEAREAIRRAWNLVEGARRSFLLLDSSIAAASENLRVQRVALREGEGTVTRVAGAEAALAAARAQRVSVAYEYDLALAGLLTASGRMDEFDMYLRRADQHVTAEGA